MGVSHCSKPAHNTRKSERFPTKWADWLYKLCPLMGSQRFAIGGKLSVGPQVDEIAA